MMYSACRLTFIDTNIGIVARLKIDNAENLYINQVWLRQGPGDWRPYHFFTRMHCGLTVDFLEAAFLHCAESRALPREDWW